MAQHFHCFLPCSHLQNRLPLHNAYLYFIALDGRRMRADQPVSRPAELARRAIIAFCAGTILLICLAFAAVAVWVMPGQDDISQKIWKLALASTDGTLRLTDAVPGEWDYVHMFGPYAPRSHVCGMLGVAPGACSREVPFESSDDGEMSLAFVAGGQVVRYVRHTAGNGDFSPVADGKPVARAQAVYRILPGAPRYNGRRSLQFVPLTATPSHPGGHGILPE